MTAWFEPAPSSIADLATVALTALGGIFVLYQYGRSNYEARARAAADEIEKFGTDESVRTALRLIDWHSGYIPYVDEAGTKHRRWFGALDYHLALRPHSMKRSGVAGYVLAEDAYATKLAAEGRECEDLFTPVEQYVRDIFDSFLGRLERIESLISSGVVSQKNFGDFFSYWIRVIGDVKSSGDDLAHFSNRKRDTLVLYINYYQFNGVIRLFARYGKDL